MPASSSDPAFDIRERADGRFDRLLVADVDGWRGLWSGELCHGSAYLDPPTLVGEVALRPGPVPEAVYLLAWLIPAIHRPTGHALMAGLGCGAGVTALLHHFPALRLTVAEIDPEVIRLACDHFPLLAHYRATGQVEIVEADIHDIVLGSGPQRWTMALLDAYQRDEHIYCPPALLAALHAHVDEVWMNIVDDEGQPRVREIAERLRAGGWPPRSLVAGFGFDDEGEFGTDNYLIGTSALERERLEAFVPFPGIAHRHAEQARRSFRAMVRRTTVL